jgi:outer membrane protein assembly complex, YaeT protein
MYKKFLLFSLMAFIIIGLKAQDNDNNFNHFDEGSDISVAASVNEDLPVIKYTSTSSDKKYAIADIQVTGVESYGYKDYMLIGISGLAVGDKISVPGDEISDALRLFWKHGLFSDVKIKATKMTADSVWLEIALKPNPLVSQVNFSGIKKGEREDLELKIGITKGSQLTPNLINRAKVRISDYFDEKGFSNSEVRIQQRDDLSQAGHIIVDIDIDKNEKTKINRIHLSGNENLSDYDLKVAMKKTNEGFDLSRRFRLSWRKMFSTKKFVKDEYENDLNNIIEKYNEKGYRDARIETDSVVYVSDKKVDIYINVDEGDKYYIRDINWVGNTLQSSYMLSSILDMKAGDVYNQKKLTERLSTDEDAVANIYYNHGYIFSRMIPVETHIENDSIDIEIRISEGTQATINRVIINGNDRVYEDIIRRELLTKPGQLFSKEALMNSARELAQMGHFDPETLDIQPIPNPETGTVDIQYNLTSKASDQIELSAGYGQTGVIGKLSLKFTNFSAKNLFNPKSYKGVIPQGEGQTLTLSGQTNGRYYQSYSVSFMDPWFGGKRPNTFSLGAYYMVTTGVESRYYDNYFNSMYNYGYNDYVYDDSKSMKILGLSVGYGKRLTWPDNYFNFMAELSYQKYWIKNWNYFPVNNGNCNNVSLGLTLSRSSIDNPIYTRSGSTFALSVNLTPPHSLWDGKDYKNIKDSDGNKYQWIEYHKWKFKGRIYIPLASREKVKRTPVLMSRIEYGFLGSYNSNKRSPFETFYMGGDGMSGYSTTYAQETIGLRGYANGSLTPQNMEAYAYSRLSLELRYPFMLESSTIIYGLAFVEAGNAWQQVKDFNPFDLKRSAGVGLRVYLPMIGLLGLDWAYGFDKALNTDAKRNGSEIHFIIGQEF